MGRAVSSSGLEAGTGARHVLTISVAVLLPLFMVAGLLLYTIVNGGRHQTERLARESAGRVMALVDARIADEIRLATILSTAQAVAEGDVAAAYDRARHYVGVSGSWRSVRLTDTAAGRELFDTARPYDGRPRLAGADVTAFAATGATAPLVGEITPYAAGGWAIPLQVPVPQTGGRKLVLTIALDPAAIQRITVANVPAASTVSGVVDAKGRFLSRTLDYEHRVGRPASASLRAAAARGGEGIYRGKTLEGKSNYTGYVASPVRGWSAHVAMGADLLDEARRLELIIWAVVASVCLVISGLLVRIALGDMARAGEAQARARQAQKMEAIGRLTGGVAHDFNNLLSVIVTGLTLVQKRLNPEDRNQRQVGASLEAARRGATLTRRLLAFSRIHELEIGEVDLAATLESMADLLRQSVGRDVTLTIDVDPAAGKVLTDRHQLELALLNMAVNARDAMPEGGALTITARRLSGHVRLAVRDTGQGMSKAVLARATDAFFTTKPEGQGTGLGLAQVHDLARHSGGELEIESEPGAGTTITLVLPVAQ